MGTITMDWVCNKSEDRKGFTISWQEPPITSASWTTNVTSEFPQLYALMRHVGSEVIDGRAREDMLARARMYIDGLLS